MPVDSKLLLFLEGCRLFYYGFPLGKLTLPLSYKNLVIFSEHSKFILFFVLAIDLVLIELSL